ncbi:hypothetical protein M9H77_16924 [Catharanthus roseus]|uniref:Uncharacterized protein n=1 Tax=Catharanthus roseus TaxID=4058 RepID=A0ACC0B366_CATRO|nr:hypothetical protein M9H77_16924 [Catharanthus roseus]
MSDSRHIGAATIPEILGKIWMHHDRLNGQSPEPETGSSDKFRHPVVNTSLNYKHTGTVSQSVLSFHRENTFQSFYSMFLPYVPHVRRYLIKILTLPRKTSTKVFLASLGLGLNRGFVCQPAHRSYPNVVEVKVKIHLGSREPNVEPRALIPSVIPRTPPLGQLRRSKVSACLSALNLQRYKTKVTSPGVLTRPPCATLAREPLMTQPARK